MGVYRGLAGTEHVQVGGRHGRCTGKNVQSQIGLKTILDQAGSEFRRQLDYKLAWNGGYLVADAAAQHQPNLSVLRPCIGGKPPEQAKFECVEVALLKNADVSARSMYRAGHARLACEVSGAVRPASSRNPPKRLSGGFNAAPEAP